jgi:hypothetical protein
MTLLITVNKNPICHVTFFNLISKGIIGKLDVA